VTLDQLGSLGEFVSAVAVVVSLLYVAREIRENSRSTRLAALQSHLDAAQRFLELRARDRDLARVIRLGQETPEVLSDDELAQFRSWVGVGMRIAENLFIQYQAGNIAEESWAARSRGFLSMLATPGGSEAWATISWMHRSDFQEWLAAHALKQPRDAV
jgi:hypothetical protein